MAEILTGDALHQFLSEGTRTAKVGFGLADGATSVTPVWFVMDGNSLVFTTMNTTLKYKRWQKDPRAAVCVDDEHFPYGFVSMKGEVSIEAMNPGQLIYWTRKIASRYVPESLVEKTAKRNAVAEEVLVRFTPHQTQAYTGIAD